MKLTNPGTVPVYTISGPSVARPLPEWLQRRRKRSRKSHPANETRFDVLQDFGFEEASICIRVSEDGNWIMSSGTYKPQFHVHSTAELSLSFTRHTKSENVTFLLLGSDYSKSLHLQNDRTLEFHTPMGCHYETRIPRFGRDLAFVRETAEALIPAVGLASDGSGLGEVFRLHLEIGQFQRPFQIDVQDPMRLDDVDPAGLQGGIDVGAVNVAALASNTHGLCAFGTSLGTVEFWDPRARVRAAVLGGHDGEVSALDFSHDGVQIAVGTSRGDISAFDLRNPRPIFKQNQGFGFPIKNIIHLLTATGERKLLSADKRIIKLWSEAEDGQLWTAIEPTVDLNCVAHVPDSGMIVTANEGQQQCSMFVPGLGPAPRWCSFLNNLVNDMGTEATVETYTNFKFLTIPELGQLNLKHLVGKTNLLRPYMHGYFVDSKLYDQARLIANPYIWEEERAKRAKEKGIKEQANRIRGLKKVKINQHLADKLLKKQENRAKIDTNAGLLGDSRFSKIFQDEDFVVDETSREFRSLNPSTKVSGVDTSKAGNKSSSSDGSEGSSDKGSSDEGGDSSDDSGEPKSNKRQDDGLVMKVSSSSQGQGGRPRKDTSLGSRAQKPGRIEKRRERDVVGEQQVTFIPEGKKTAKAEQPAPPQRRFDGRRSASNNTFRRF